MKTKIFEKLEFLLTIHNCVAIPDFGGFIINIDPAVLCSNGEINPPKQNIVFNPDLKHDDGILTSYISKDENIPYNIASRKIKSVVSELKIDIKSGKRIVCSRLGELIMNDEGNITFIANKLMLFPLLLGLTPTEIKRLSVIDNIAIKERRNVSLKYVTGSIAAAAAAILLFIAPSGNIKDTNIESNIQNADFISGITSSLSSINQENIEAVTITNNTEEAVVAETKTISPRTYYIVIGGEEDKNRAEILLDKIQKNSFPKADILFTNDRYRIYVSSFEDKTEAEAFLSTFRKENPAFETAWLFSKRNY